MKKYDCSKMVDLIHEYRRLCNDNITCMSCPIFKPDEWLTRCHLEDLGDAELKMIQKWSDEHPENPPKLTRKDYDFLSGFKKIDNRYIWRGAGDCYLLIPDMECQIGVADGMFSFIQEGMGNGWSFEDLLELEVEDE